MTEIKMEVVPLDGVLTAVMTRSEELKIAAEAKIAAEMPILDRIKKQYGVESAYQAGEIYRAEKDIETCAKCTGYPCKARGFKQATPIIRVADGQFQDIAYKPCRYKKQEALKKKYGLSNIPRQYNGKTWADYAVDENNRVAVLAAKKLVNMPQQGAYFYGGVGTGKTFLVSLLAQEVLKAGRAVFFTTIPNLSLKLRSTFKKDTKITEEEILEKLATVPTLILDDVGIEKPTRFISALLANIFNERYNAGLQTVLTSNYNLKSLEGIYNNPSDGETLDGSRIYDRCKQMSPPLELKGGSRR